MDELAFERCTARPRVAAKARRKLLARRVILSILVAFWLAAIFGFLILLISQHGHKDRVAYVAPSEPSASVTSVPPKTRDPIAPLHTDKTETPFSAVETESTVSQDDLNYLAGRNLLIPVAGVKASQLRDSFDQARSEARTHKALDIMAPQGTPVLATSDGVVLKLFQSVNGGITLYQLDPSKRYAFYYAHLMRYADGITEGKQLMRGDTLGYVGDTGNAGPGNFHLHFAISKLGSPRKWSAGEPINPFPLLVGK